VIAVDPAQARRLQEAVVEVAGEDGDVGALERGGDSGGVVAAHVDEFCRSERGAQPLEVCARVGDGGEHAGHVGHRFAPGGAALYLAVA
jgi:hypothetical protein